MKFLIVSFDGLRPDLIESALTPNIDRLRQAGVTLSRHRTVYPSETRVAFPSLVTGATPNRHGMVGNNFVDRGSVPGRYLDTSDAVLLDHLNRESNGRLMTAPTLGELLKADGKSLAVLATNTPGTTRLFNHKAEELGHIRFSGHFREACSPVEALAMAEAEIGPLSPAPPRGEPDRDGQEWITSAFLNFVWPRQQPDVTILSYGEPDTTSHFHGTGSRATRETIAFCDAQFGRVLDWWESEGRAADVQLIAISDHGHVTAHTRVSVAASLQAAGFSTGIAPGTGVDVTVVPGQVGALYLANRSQSNLSHAVEALINEPWCGPIFTRSRNGVEGLALGSFANSLVFADHERAPDVYFAFRADDRIDPFGLAGGTYFDGVRSPGLGVHGGLHSRELACVGMAAGSAFKGDGSISAVPSGICDITPTILHLLNMPNPLSMTGRVLHEVFDGSPHFSAALNIEPEIFETGLNSYRQTLRRVRVADTVYLEGAAATVSDERSARHLEAIR
ncbi:alkaline phosphatase family protein [Rhizobium leguminosarum]|nr:alkaline phosphatase family protein [Rhizobium leguminosarum]MBY5664937.1 alkaline phosphatase family protein [Rhizobium leguminosarum]MBY5677579.1 alkaline phosphatase family protein [Rhizobium leguminosarum]